MAKRKSKEEIETPPENAIVVVNEGPIHRSEFYGLPGHVTEVTGSNGTGKSEFLKCLKALATGDTSELSLRDGAESGYIAGFGRTIKIMGRICKVTGMFDVGFFEEGFTLATLVDPGSKASDKNERAKTNDKQRIKNLASIMGIQIEDGVVYEMVGGCGGARKSLELEIVRQAISKSEYDERLLSIQKAERLVARSLISLKTQKLTDPAEYIAGLKDDCDKAALEREKTFAVVDVEADALESTLPAEGVTGETDEEVLSARVASAANEKRELERRDESAADAKKLADAAGEILKAGQGQSVEDADKALAAAQLEEKDSRKLIDDIKTMLAKEEEKLEGLERRRMDMADAVTAAKGRAQKLETARKDLEAKIVVPTSQEWEDAEKEIKAASDAMILGAELRKAVKTRETIEEKREEVESLKVEAENLRQAAQNCASLLIRPINELGCGIEIDEDMRVVCVNHPIRGRCYFEELSDGERWRAVIRLMTAASIGVDLPAIVPMPQRMWLELDPKARQEFREEVAKTKLIVFVAKATAFEQLGQDGQSIFSDEPISAKVLG